MKEKRISTILWYVLLIALTCLFLFPIAIVLMNSFKGQFHIAGDPFSFPHADTFAGLANYLNGIRKIGFFKAAGLSLFITAASVALIVVCTSMTAWFLVRNKSKLSSALYYLLVFSMIVPFQMVMFTQIYRWREKKKI